MKRIINFFCISFLISLSVDINAQDAKFQSLTIYNITKLIDWPNKTGNFIVKIIGNSDLVKELRDFTLDRKAGGKQTFDIIKAETGNYSNCNILYIGESECANIEQIVASVGSNPTLIITEKPDLTLKGAGVSFIKIEGTWKFQYNENNIKKNGLKVSLDFKELGISK